MVKVEKYENINQQQWRALVERSPHATWFQTPEAYRFYASVSDMLPFAYGVSEEGRLVGVVLYLHAYLAISFAEGDT